MYARITCHPPLGEPTVVDRNTTSIPFTALLETDPSSAKSFEIALWSNIGSKDEWKEYTLEDSQDEPLQVSAAGQYRRRFFRLDLPVAGSMHDDVRFTIKFRTNDDSTWKWAGDEFHASDGSLSFQKSDKDDQQLSDYLLGTDSHFKVNPTAAETPDTQLWHLEAPVPAAGSEERGYSEFSIGTPKKASRWFATVRLWSPWMAPRQGKGSFSVDKDAIMVAFERKDGKHVVALGLSGVDSILTVFRNGGDGEVMAQFKNDAPHSGTGRVFVAVSEKFDYANAAVMYLARHIVMSKNIESGELQKETAIAQDKQLEQQDVHSDWYEEWADGFSYCTWNGLGQNLTEEKILNALDSLEKVNIKVTNLIIDDNWQSLDNEGKNQIHRGMTEFEANKKGFPNGMKHCIERIKRSHDNVRHVGVWHALLGYWGAISPDGALAKEYKTIKAKNGWTGEWTVIAAEDVERFYDDFYRFLSSCGIDSVKTDAQFQLDDLWTPDDRLKLIPRYQDAWTLANLRHLGGRAISCMSQAPPLIFHSQLPNSRPRILLRNSDDFFPDIDSSHAWHIFCNANNALLTRYLNVLPDWDMFQTIHDYARFHAVGRCVSGGPIYFTDEPGKHDVKLINQMTAQTPRGNTVILRPSVVGHSTHPYREYGDGRLCIVATYTGASETGTSIIGVFNVSPSPITEMLSLSAFPGTETANERGAMYIVRSHSSGKISSPIHTTSQKKAIVVVDLEVKGCDVLSAYPLRTITATTQPDTEAAVATGTEAKGSVTVANLGLVGKFTAAAAVVSTQISLQTNGRIKIWTSLKALGTWGIYMSNLPDISIEDNLMVLLFGQPIGLHCVKQSKDDEHVLEIDAARAWEEGEKRQTWSNEVQMELYVRCDF